MKFELYTKAEAAKQAELHTQISDNNDKLTEKSKAAKLSDFGYEILSADPEYIEITRENERLNKELSALHKKAFKRYTKKIDENYDDFCLQCEKALDNYEDYSGFDFLHNYPKIEGMTEQENEENARYALFQSIKRFTGLYIPDDQNDWGNAYFPFFSVLFQMNLKTDDIIERYNQLKAVGEVEKYLKEHEIAAKKKSLPKVTITHKGVQGIDFPLDKINSNVFNRFNKLSKTGETPFKMEPKGSKIEATALYSIDFEDLENTGDIRISRELNSFDKRCYLSAASLFSAGFPIVTVQQIYNAMGYTGRAGADSINKINDSLTKMMFAHIHINNSKEAEVLKGYDRFVYDGPLLSMERISAVVNGQIAESAIHLLKEPPLIEFARGRKQITKIDHKVLESPVNKTDHNLQIDDYLLTRISRMKNPKNKSSKKILYKTIFENAGLTERKQCSRGKEIIKRYLDHYKKTDFISDFFEGEDGITIKLKC